MSLYARIAGSNALADDEEMLDKEGVNCFAADLFTSNWVVRAEMTSPEQRLSDYLNGSFPSIDMRPRTAAHPDESTVMDLEGTSASVLKDSILMAIPVREPKRIVNPAHPDWRPLIRHRCWLALGPYRLLGTLHVEKGRDPRVALRLLDQQFVPVTEVSVSGPSSEPRQYPVVLINQAHLDLLAVKDTP